MEALAKEIESEETRQAHQLPDPTGYKILIALPDPEKEFDGGIIKSNKTLYEEEIGSIVGFVTKLGPDCYNDKKRFPSGPFCKEGDWILMRSYSGTRFKVHRNELRIINEDTEEAEHEHPSGIDKT